MCVYKNNRLLDQPDSIPEKIICWSCSKRSPPGNCIHCGAQIMSADEIKKRDEPVPIKHVIEIKHQGVIIQKIDLDKLSELVSRHFNVTKSLLTASPRFLVDPPETALDPIFEDLIKDSNELLEGLTPKIEKINNRSPNLVIQYAYFEPLTPTQFRRNSLLVVFTFISMLLAGLYNFRKFKGAQGNKIDTFSFTGLPISSNSVVFALQFSLTLLFILLVKDFIQMRINKRYNDVQLTPYYIPAPPIFELGTLGSFISQRKIHLSKRSLFYSALWGPIVAWIVSIGIIVYSLQWSVFNPTGAEAYASHSIVANGNYEPLGLNLITIFAKKFNFWDGTTEGHLTRNYLFSPITLAGLVGFYISGLSLLPAMHLNGGYLIRAKYGKQVHVFTTYLVLAYFLFILGYIILLLLLIQQRIGAPEVLNEESEAPRYSIYWIIFILLIAFLSLPVAI